MDVKGELQPGRDFAIAFLVCSVAGLLILSVADPDFPVLHTILNTGIALATVVLALLFWDLGWRTGSPLVRCLAIVMAVTSVLEIAHVLAALDPATGSAALDARLASLRSGTWAPPAYLLPLGIGLLLAVNPTPATSRLAFGALVCAVGIALSALFQSLPRYGEPGAFGIVRPSLLGVPLLWIPVAVTLWRRRGADRLGPALAWYALGQALANLFMLYSEQAASPLAMVAHFGVFASNLYLLVSVMQMGTLDTVRRMSAEAELRASNETLEARVVERTAALESANANLRHEIGVRQEAEDKLQKAYEDLRLTRDAVLEQERLRALGQMASGIAHDINNAISPVSLYIDAVLTYESGFSDRARRQLEIVQRAVGDVAQTVKRLGEFYRMKPAQLELAPVDLPLVLQEVLELTRARWSDMAQQRGVVIDTRVEIAVEQPVVMAIESELREALVNLVLNATDAMPDGGVLTLRAGQWPVARRIGEHRTYIEVQDTGHGMNDDVRRRCLEPFFTTKGERGSGLGLAMVYGIAQRHGMDLEITSAPGAGATIRLVFPPAVPSSQTTSVRVPMIPNHTRILLIDDDPILLASLCETLAEDGHQVQTASGGRAGIDAFLAASSGGQPFPIVITDLGMPHVDGRAVAAAVKAARPDTEILMLTGWGQRLIGSGEVPPEVRAVLSKPPRIQELRQQLADIAGARDAA